MREQLDEANKAPMIELPRWVAWTGLVLLLIGGLAMLTVVGIGHHR